MISCIALIRYWKKTHYRMHEWERERDSEKFKHSQHGALMHLWSGCFFANTKYVCVPALSRLLLDTLLAPFVVKQT